MSRLIRALEVVRLELVDPMTTAERRAQLIWERERILREHAEQVDPFLVALTAAWYALDYVAETHSEGIWGQSPDDLRGYAERRTASKTVKRTPSRIRATLPGR